MSGQDVDVGDDRKLDDNDEEQQSGGLRRVGGTKDPSVSACW